MSAAPTPPEDDLNASDCDSSRRKLQSSTLPPVLFELPNLSVADDEASASCADADADICAGKDAVDDARAADAETPVFEPAPIASVAQEPKPQPVPEPAANVPERPTAKVANVKEESAFDIWGTRAIVVTLLLLVISSAFVAARKSRNKSNRPVADISSEISADDVSALEDFAVTEGIDVADVIVEPAIEEQSITANEFNALLAEIEVAPSEVAPNKDANIQLDVLPVDINDDASTATLAAPLTESTAADAGGHPPAETPAINAVADARSNATIGPAESIAAATASSRTETPATVEVLKPAEQTNETASPATPTAPLATTTPAAPKLNPFAITIPDVHQAADGEAATAGPQLNPPTDFSASNPATSPTNVVPEDLTATKPIEPTSTSGPNAFRYSSTPNGITDWDQYWNWARSRLNPQTTQPQTD